MAAQLQWITDEHDGDEWLLTCGHTTTPANGRPGPEPGEWYCEMCALHVTAQLDQELAFVADELAKRDGRQHG